MFQSVPLWMTIAGFLLMLGPLVTLHELGHYLVARLFGVKAEAFSVGFGKELLGHTDRRGTRWKLSLLPLGGYVQFKGDMNPASIPDPNFPVEDGAFQHAKLWQKALIVAAGPVTNLLIAVFVFSAFAFTYGKFDESGASTLKIQQFAPESAGHAAGLLVGDRITAIDHDPVASHADVVEQVVLYPGKHIALTVERSGQVVEIPLTIATSIEHDEFGNEMRAGRIGVMFAPPGLVPVGPVEALGIGIDQTGSSLSMMVTGIVQIFTGDRSVKELGGPITMAKYSGEQLSLGPQQFVWFVAFISINLAFINLLPIPALDGGHLAFYAVQAIRGKPASARSQEWAFRTGMALVLALMVFVTLIDIAKLPIFGG